MEEDVRSVYCRECGHKFAEADMAIDCVNADTNHGVLTYETQFSFECPKCFWGDERVYIAILQEPLKAHRIIKLRK